MITVGTVVQLKVECLGNPEGTFGVGFNDYGSGCQVIFENGEYDGFSKEEQKTMLKEVGMAEEEAVTRYSFKNVMQVSRDFMSGLWDGVLKNG